MMLSLRRHGRTYVRWASILAVVVFCSYLAFRCVDPAGQPLFGDQETVSAASAAAAAKHAHLKLPLGTNMGDFFRPRDTNPDPQPLEADHTTTPIYVMDEHHHALPLWFAESYEQKLTPATLVHIDAHSDGASPNDFRTLLDGPLFTRASVRTENDEFIIAAMWKGIVNRTIWVIPDWAWDFEMNRIYGNTAAVSHEEKQVLPHRHEVHLGPLREDDIEPGSDDEVICICEMVLDDDEWIAECDTVPELDDGEFIDYDDCDIQRRVPVQVVPTDRMLNEGALILRGADEAQPPVILDLDEDFFCTADIVDQWRSYGWRNHTLLNIDEALLRFCAADEHEETKLSRLLLRAFKDRLSANELGDEADAEFSRYLCETHHYSWTEAIAKLQQAFKVATAMGVKPAETMLKGIEDIGIATRPNAFSWPVAMALVSGKGNGPVEDLEEEDAAYETNTAITFYVPTTEQLDARLLDFDRLLEHGGFKDHVEFVTLCRSIRDGYLPKNLLERVEGSMLDSLQRHLRKPRVHSEGARLWDM